MAKLGVPLVDAGRLVEGQVWATSPADGRHFHPIVPLELYTMLSVVLSPTPLLPCAPDTAVGVSMVDVMRDGPKVVVLGGDG